MVSKRYGVGRELGLLVDRKVSRHRGVLTWSLVVILFESSMLRLELGDLFLQSNILLAKSFVLLFKPFRDVLQRDIALDLALLIELDTSLKFSELRLLALAESTLGGSGRRLSSWCGVTTSG